MATLRARATMTPLDVERWIRTATATLEHSRLLECTDAGVLHPQTGVVHAGWRDLDGTHPRDGRRYLVTTIDAAGVECSVAVIEGGYFAGPAAVDATIDLERRRGGVA